MESKNTSSSSSLNQDAKLSTNTVVLSRKNIGMIHQILQDNKGSEKPTPDPVSQPNSMASNPQKSSSTPAGNIVLAKKMTESYVWCPFCNSDFEIVKDCYGVLAECSECEKEFKIPSEPTEKVKISTPQLQEKKRPKNRTPKPQAEGSSLRAETAKPSTSRSVYNSNVKKPVASSNSMVKVMIGLVAVLLIIIVVLLIVMLMK